MMRFVVTRAHSEFMLSDRNMDFLSMLQIRFFLMTAKRTEAEQSLQRQKTRIVNTTTIEENLGQLLKANLTTTRIARSLKKVANQRRALALYFAIRVHVISRLLDVHRRGLPDNMRQ